MFGCRASLAYRTCAHRNLTGVACINWEGRATGMSTTKIRSTGSMSRAHLALHRHDVDVKVACCIAFLRLHYLPQSIC